MPVEVRPRGRRLADAIVKEANRLFEEEAAGNGVVVHRLLRERGVGVSRRILQRVLQPKRRELRRRQAVSVRYETGPGKQLQIDFGEKWVTIGKGSAVLVRGGVGLFASHFR